MGRGIVEGATHHSVSFQAISDCVQAERGPGNRLHRQEAFRAFSLCRGSGFYVRRNPGYFQVERLQDHRGMVFCAHVWGRLYQISLYTLTVPNPSPGREFQEAPL